MIYKSDSSSSVWSNAYLDNGYEIRIDSSNRLNVYRVMVSYSGVLSQLLKVRGYSTPSPWTVTRISWKDAPKYVHDVKKNMLAVLKVIAQRQRTK